MIAHLLSGQPMRSLRDIDYVVPDVHYPVPLSKLAKLPFYVVKSHEPRRRGSDADRYKRVIYIVRDPRDVGASYYRYLVNNGLRDVPIDRFVLDYSVGRIGPCSWQEHVAAWLDFGSDPPDREMLLLRYEDMVESPTDAIKQVASFLGCKVTSQKASDIAAMCSRENMAKKEAIGNRPEIESGRMYFVGQAKPGSWKGVLDSGMDQQVVRRAAMEMRRLNYIS
jgi:hypothetical protein